MHNDMSRLRQYMHTIMSRYTTLLTSLLLLCIVVVWCVVTLRISQPRLHTMTLPDQRTTIAMPFVDTFDVPFRWVRINERVLPTVITNLPTNIRIALATYIFPQSEYVLYRGVVATPYLSAPIMATLTWNQQQHITNIEIPIQPTRVIHIIAPLTSVKDVMFTYNIEDIRAHIRSSSEPISDTDFGVALTSFTSNPVIVSQFITLLVILIQGTLSVMLSYIFFRWCSRTPVPFTVSSAFGLMLSTLVTIYEFIAGQPQTSTVWWVFLSSTVLVRSFALIDLPHRLPRSVLFTGIPLLIAGTIFWYAPYASNGCFRTIIPPHCTLTQMDYWVHPWQSLQQLPQMVFPPVDGVRYSAVAPLPPEIQPFMAGVVFVLTSLMVKYIRGWQLALPLPLTTTIAVSALLTMGLPGMFPGILWMNVLDPLAYGTWETWLAGVTTMRIPVSPLTLAVEGWLIKSAFGFGIYKWIIFRIMLIGILTLALFTRKNTRYFWYLAAICGLLVASYSAYYSQMLAANYIAYVAFTNDILLVFSLLLIAYILQRSHINKWHLLAIGGLLVVADNTRPYMVVFTPIISILVCWYLIPRVPKHWLMLVVIPLLPLVIWHGHHFFNLKQTTWSNHTGYNLCNAWPCPNDVVFQPESPRISIYRGTNLNTEVHTQNSQHVTKSMIAYNLQDPGRTFVRGVKLLLFSMSMPSPHVTSIFELRFPEVKAAYPEWHVSSADAQLDRVLAESLWPPYQPLPMIVLIGNAYLRILFFMLFAAQALYFVRFLQYLVHSMTNRTPFRLPHILRRHGVYGGILLGMYAVSSFSEFGENYRWATMMGMAALYLPYTHLFAYLRRKQNTLPKIRKTLWS